jgi:hypothetical protein
VAATSARSGCPWTGQRGRGGDGDLVGHGHHRRHPQLAHQPLGQTAQIPGGFGGGAGAFTRAEEGKAGQGPELPQPLQQQRPGDGIDGAAIIGEVESGFAIPRAARDRAVPHDVEQGVAAVRDVRAQSIQRRRTEVAGDGLRSLSGGQHIALDVAEGRAHTVGRGDHVERLQPEFAQVGRAGDDDESPHLVAVCLRKAAVGGRREIEGERGLLVECQHLPAVADRGAQPFPAAFAQIRVLDREQHAQRIIVGRLGAGGLEGVANILAEERLAQHLAVGARLERRGQQRALALGPKEEHALGAEAEHGAPAGALHHDRPPRFSLTLDGDLEGAHRLPRRERGRRRHGGRRLAANHGCPILGATAPARIRTTYGFPRETAPGFACRSVSGS